MRVQVSSSALETLIENPLEIKDSLFFNSDHFILIAGSELNLSSYPSKAFSSLFHQ